jgi:hypothetical protein
VSTDLLETAARALGPMCDRVVFLGGATITLWLTDPAARPPRVTLDVDVVAEVVTLGSYERFQQDLRDQHSDDFGSGCLPTHALGEVDLNHSVPSPDPKVPR